MTCDSQPFCDESREERDKIKENLIGAYWGWRAAKERGDDEAKCEGALIALSHLIHIMGWKEEAWTAQPAKTEQTLSP